jgi:hypothetical protein
VALEKKLMAMSAATGANDVPLIRALLKDLVVDYQASGEVVDWVHLEQEKSLQAQG